MGYKLVVDCDICGSDFRIKSRPSRHERWAPDEETDVECGFNLMTDAQREKVEGQWADSELYFETVCKPCRTAIRDAVNVAIKKLRGK